MKRLLLLISMFPLLLNAAAQFPVFFETYSGTELIDGAPVRYMLRGKSLSYFFGDRGYSVVQRNAEGKCNRTDFLFIEDLTCVPQGETELRSRNDYRTNKSAAFSGILYPDVNGNSFSFHFENGYLKKSLQVKNPAYLPGSLLFVVSGSVPQFQDDSDKKSLSYVSDAGSFAEIPESPNVAPVFIMQNSCLKKNDNTLTWEWRSPGGEEPATNAVISWLTYLGGTNADDVFGIALLPGNLSVLAGRTSSTDFPSLPGGIQDTLNASYDVFVSCFDSSGTCLWSTYYGGSAFESAYGITTKDSLVLVVGSTNSSDLLTVNAYQDTCAGSYDAFLLLLDYSGQMLYSTYFGGAGADQVFAAAVDTSGNFAVAGSTTSMNLPLASSGYQPVPAGAIDAFIATFDQQLQPSWSTCFGGSSTEDAHAITVSPQGEIIFCGGTYSANLPVTNDAWQGAPMGTPDIYIAKFGMDGTRHYVTYFGGTASEDANGIVSDSAGNFYITGYTFSVDFPVQGNAFQTTLAAQSDICLARFDAAGQLSWSTFIGGNGAESGIAMYRLGKYLFIAGNTESTDFPVNVNALQTSYAGNSDGFVAKTDTAGNMVMLTYQGGTGVDALYGITVIPADTSVVACGNTYSNDLPVNAGAFQQNYAGSGDAYVLRFGMSEELSTVSVTAPVSPANGLSVYPNPANDFVFVHSSMLLSRVVVTDMNGREISAQELNGYETQIQTASLAKGVYLVWITGEEGAVSPLRLIRQ